MDRKLGVTGDRMDNRQESLINGEKAPTKPVPLLLVSVIRVRAGHRKLGKSWLSMFATGFFTSTRTKLTLNVIGL